MVTTPGTGTYAMYFNTSGTGTTNQQLTRYGLFSDGTLINSSERSFKIPANAVTNIVIPMSTQVVHTVNGSNVIDVKYRTSSGTITFGDRNLILLKLT